MRNQTGKLYYTGHICELNGKTTNKLYGKAVLHVSHKCGKMKNPHLRQPTQYQLRQHIYQTKRRPPRQQLTKLLSQNHISIDRNQNPHHRWNKRNHLINKQAGLQQIYPEGGIKITALGSEKPQNTPHGNWPNGNIVQLVKVAAEYVSAALTSQPRFQGWPDELAIRV